MWPPRQAGAGRPYCIQRRKAPQMLAQCKSTSGACSNTICSATCQFRRILTTRLYSLLTETVYGKAKEQYGESRCYRIYDRILQLCWALTRVLYDIGIIEPMSHRVKESMRLSSCPNGIKSELDYCKCRVEISPDCTAFYCATRAI